MYRPGHASYLHVQQFNRLVPARLTQASPPTSHTYRGPILGPVEGATAAGPDLSRVMLVVEVPGLAEGRPSLALGDVVYVR